MNSEALPILQYISVHECTHPRWLHTLTFESCRRALLRDSCINQPVSHTHHPPALTLICSVFFPFHSLILSPFRMCSNFILKGSVCHPSLCERQHSAPVSAQHLVPSLYYIVPSSMNKSIHILINTADDLL